MMSEVPLLLSLFYPEIGNLCKFHSYRLVAFETIINGGEGIGNLNTDNPDKDLV